MDWKIISDTEPSSFYTGKLWIRPGISGVRPTVAYIKLGDSWLPAASTSIIPFEYGRITILIDGNDVSGLVEKSSLSMEDILTSEVDTCNFILNDYDGDSAPLVGQEVIIFYKDTILSDPEIKFAGKITNAPQRQLGVGVYAYDIEVVDYSHDLQKRQVVENFTSTTAGSIIRSITGEYAKEIGTYHVEDGETVEYISFNYKYPFECIQQLAELTGYNWYVDTDRNIRFFANTSYTAPYPLTETLDLENEEYKNLVIEVDKSNLKNSQLVRGGYELSDDYTQITEITTDQHDVKIAYVPYSADSGTIELYIDTGGGYGAKIIPGIDNIATSDDYVINQSEAVLKDQNSNWAAGHLVKLIYKYKKRILAKVKDSPSIELMKQYEGGDGIYEGELIIDETIETKEAARQRGEAELTSYSNPIISGSFTTTKSGYRSGQLLTVNLPSRGYNNKTYMIQSVSATSLGNGDFEYEIKFASRLKGLTDFLAYLYDRGKKVYERNDDVLDTLEQFGEIILIGESIPETTIRNIITNPYKWSNDAGTTTGKGQWNKAEWQ